MMAFWSQNSVFKQTSDPLLDAILNVKLDRFAVTSKGQWLKQLGLL